MTSVEIRQSFLNFFKSKGHTLVPSSSLMPDSPNLLFTNAGMNQFVPIFLGQRAADVAKWAEAVPGSNTRAADTQKCIRAGGKHNDLEDVGLDTYHHTFFEMLGNWSFGDYFKQEAIEWAWELITEVWKFPKNRLYATVYSPDKSKGDPSDFDQEAYDIWAAKFRAAGLDPAIHIVNGNKKDNFWMMGDTGPCGPCSELHVDLTPQGDTKGRLVNQGTAECIEIWNLVFIQFNANPDGTFSPLPARHVDTGMGFERVTGIIQNTRNFTDFSRVISNYETDIFRPIFDKIEKLSGKKYGSTLPLRLPRESHGQVREIVCAIPAGKVLTTGEIGAMCHPPKAADSVRTAVEGYQRVAEIKLAFQSEHEANVDVQKRREIPCWRVVNDEGLLILKAAEQQIGRLSAEGVQVSGMRVDLNQYGLLASQFRGDIAFRVIADHIRTVSFAIADGILPSNSDRGYVLRRILRRAVRYGRSLGFHEPFFYKLVPVLVENMGHAFPEIRAKQVQVEEIVHREEDAFNKTIESGIEIFEKVALPLAGAHEILGEMADEFEKAFDWEQIDRLDFVYSSLNAEEIQAIREESQPHADAIVRLAEQLAGKPLPSTLTGTGEQLLLRAKQMRLHLEKNSDWEETAQRMRIFDDTLRELLTQVESLPGDFAFKLYDTYGFPIDLTILMAKELGLDTDEHRFWELLEEQRKRARAAQKKEIIELSQVETTTATQFVGYEKLDASAKVLEVVSLKDKTAVILDISPLYAEMGGQVGDTGELNVGGQMWRIVNTQKAGEAWLHFLDVTASGTGGVDIPTAGDQVTLVVDRHRREAIQRHHTVTHLLHWALHEVVSKDAAQKGSYVGPEKLTFDFSSAPLTPQQVADVERLVNERILENAPVNWTEVKYNHIKERKDIRQFFGEKYGDWVRVVQIGGKPTALDGYSMELCGGTHVRGTGEIGLFRIGAESAIAAGIRRIEAYSGLEAYRHANDDLHLLRTIAGTVNTPVAELDKKIESLLARQKELEKQLKAMQQQQAVEIGRSLIAKARSAGAMQVIIENLGNGDGDFLQAVADGLKGQFKGVVVLGGVANGSVALMATVSSEFTRRVQAGKIIQAIAPIVGGKGGGRPDNARGGGKEVSKLNDALKRAGELVGQS